MLPAMCGSATFTTVVSSTSMKVPNMTAMAMNHGFTAGWAGVPSAIALRRAVNGGEDALCRRRLADRRIEAQVVQAVVAPIDVELAADEVAPRAIHAVHQLLGIVYSGQPLADAVQAVFARR